MDLEFDPKRGCLGGGGSCDAWTGNLSGNMRSGGRKGLRGGGEEEDGEAEAGFGGRGEGCEGCDPEEGFDVDRLADEGLVFGLPADAEDTPDAEDDAELFDELAVARRKPVNRMTERRSERKKEQAICLFQDDWNFLEILLCRQELCIVICDGIVPMQYVGRSRTRVTNHAKLSRRYPRDGPVLTLIESRMILRNTLCSPHPASH